MMNSNLKTLAEIEALRKLAGDIGWTIREIMGRITGYMGCPLAQRYRAIGFTSEDPEWIEWRGRVLDDAHSWRKHAQILLTKFREHDGTAIGNILDAVGESPSNITKMPYWSHFSYGKKLLELSSTCLDNLIDEPGFFFSHAIMGQHCGGFFSHVNDSFVDFNIYSRFGFFLKQVFDDKTVEFCRSQHFGSEMEVLLHHLNINIDAEFIRAKQMAMELKESPEPVAEPIQLATNNSTKFATNERAALIIYCRTNQEVDDREKGKLKNRIKLHCKLKIEFDSLQKRFERSGLPENAFADDLEAMKFVNSYGGGSDSGKKVRKSSQ